jgi:Ca2+-binding RTX toxin-like protein
VPGESYGSPGVRVAVERTYAGDEFSCTGSHVTSVQYGANALNLGNIGLSLGSAIGNAIGGNSFLGHVAASTIVGTFTQNLAQFAQNGYQISLLDHVAGRPATETIVEDALATAFNDFGAELLQNGISNLASGVSSLLMGELAQSLGLEGFGAGLFSTIGTTITSRLITNALGAITTGGTLDTSTLFSGFTPTGLLSSIGGSVGGYFGSYLASQLIQPVSGTAAIGTQIGSALGAAVGVSAAAQGFYLGLELGSFAGPIGAFVGSFVGTILGTVLGNAIAPDPEVTNIVGLNPNTHAIGTNARWADYSGDIKTFDGLAATVSNTVNYIVDLTGAHILTAGSLVMYEKGTTYSVSFYAGGGAAAQYYQFQNRLTTDRQAAWVGAADWASTHLARSLTLEGGDAIVRHALEASDGTNSAAMITDLLVARDYERYIEDPTMINALIAAQPDSTFATGWALTLLRARELGLDQIGRGTDAAEALNGAELDDHLRGLAGDDVIHGGVGDDFLDGGDGADQLFGDAGNDTLKGGAGVDRLVGGLGDDAYLLNSLEDVIVENANEGTDTIRTNLSSYTLAANFENLVYTGTGVFTGTGNSAANVLQGGADRDTLTGGAGNDTYIVDGVADLIVETTGGGTDTVKTGIASYVLDVNVENLTYTGTAVFTGTGNALNNIITGAGAADILSGAAGNDTLDGGAGADQLIGGDGNDIYVVDNVGDVIVENVSEGTDTVRTALASYTLAANVENLIFTGVAPNDGTILGSVTPAFIGAGNDLNNNITGGAGNDTLTGGAGNDTLDGGLGNDRMIGGVGNDTFVVNIASDVIVENANEGVDTVRTSLTNYTLGANLENLVLTSSAASVGSGNAVANALTGGQGADRLYGLGGNDTLTGGLGADTLDAGSGSDAYVWKKGDGADTINDTSAVLTETDSLTLSNVASTEATLTRNGGDLIVTIVATGESLTIANQYYEYVDEFGAVSAAAGYGVETIAFSDGVIWSLNDIVGHTLTNGTAGADILNGTWNYADQLYGLVGNDTVYGLDGNDTLVGGLGADILDGGNGSDIYVWNKGDGADKISDSSITLTETDILALGDVVSNDVTLTRSGVNLLLTVNSTGEVITVMNRLYTPSYGYGLEGVQFSDGVSWTLDDILAHTATNGTAANNSIAGTAFADNIYGFAGNDTINAGLGDDKIYGGAGNDTLTGGGGLDAFVFDTALGATNIDKITDYSVANDNIVLSQSVFSAAGPIGALSSGAFRIGTAATAATDRIIYNAATGALYYDPDGNGAAAQVQFATLSVNLALTAAEFRIV